MATIRRSAFYIVVGIGKLFIFVLSFTESVLKDLDVLVKFSGAILLFCARRGFLGQIRGLLNLSCGRKTCLFSRAYIPFVCTQKNLGSVYRSFFYFKRNTEQVSLLCQRVLWLEFQT